MRIVLAGIFGMAALALGLPSSAIPGGSEANFGILPKPARASGSGDWCARADVVLRALRAGHLDAGGTDLLGERWHALGIRVAPASLDSGFRARSGTIRSGGDPQSYRLTIDAGSVTIAKHGAEGEFYALTTLAQLPRRDREGVWRLPCAQIEDAPALRWRVLSDDVSRGPLPTLRYFKERIRTIAAFKMNGYSPYMEHVFLDPRHPLPAPLDGITPLELRELRRYADRYHVALIPEQQTFAHMHETLRWERYAPLAELPHGYLIAPANAAGESYVRDLISDELRAAGDVPFFHIGSDEPSDLGRGASASMVRTYGEAQVFIKHAVDTANFVLSHSHARPLIWDDAVAAHPELFSALPKGLVFVTWHYGNEPSYRPYIDRISKGGFEQMVAPGALNWNEIYPNLTEAMGNIARFVSEGKEARVLGLFQTVWHDDGETLFEASWYPVLFAGACAWETGPCDARRYADDFPWAFFGARDGRYRDDLAALAKARESLKGSPREYGDYLFWSDPFDPAFADLDRRIDLGALRNAAEIPAAHLKSARPPLHQNAARVMYLAALRYDLLGRQFQIAREARAYYDDARANADGKHDNFVFRGLFVSKYLLWELRDRMLELEPLVKAAWEYEDRPSHEASVLERYHLAAQRAIARADAVNRATYEGYVARKTLPTFDEALGLAPP